MTEREHETITVARKIRYDLTAAQIKITELLNALGRLDLPAESDACPRCGVPVHGPLTLAEHVHTSHGGPVPEHWLAIEARSVEA